MNKFVKTLLFLVVLVIALSSCANKDSKEESLNVDVIMNNDDCLLAKQFTVGTNKNSTLVYFDQNCVTIEFVPNSANQNNLKREYYFYRDNNIYYTKTSSKTSNLTKKIDGDKYGIGNDFNKFKRLLQLSFIYVNFTLDELNIEEFYNTIIDDNNITFNFSSNLGFYDNVRNYYNSLFPNFNNDATKYKIGEFDVITQNNNFKMINAYFDEYSLVVVKSDLVEYTKSDLSLFKEYEVDSYIDKLSTIGNVSYTTMKDDLLEKIKPNDNSNNIVRKVSGFYLDDNSNYIELLMITEYETNNICKNIYEDYMNNYYPNYYIGYKGKLLFILKSATENSKYKSTLDVEFKTPTKYIGTNISLEEVTSFYSNGLLYKNDLSGEILNTYSDYQKFVTKVKELDSPDNINLNLISEQNFTSNKYIVVQLRKRPEGKEYKYKYKLSLSILNNSSLNIAYEKQVDASESYVEDDCCLYTIYKVSNDINISSINANALTII